MSRTDELNNIIQQAKDELDSMKTADEMSVRTFARLAGISLPVAHRIRNNVHNVTLRNARRALPFLRECPCCDRPVQS